MTELDDKELTKRVRQNLLDVLDLWASKESQLEYQRNVPIAQVSAELFCQWADDFYHPDSTHFKMAFDEREKGLLAEFDKVLNDISDKAPTDLPYITEFVKTNEWLVINQAAVETLKKIRNTAANMS